MHTYYNLFSSNPNLTKQRTTIDMSFFSICNAKFCAIPALKYYIYIFSWTLFRKEMPRYACLGFLVAVAFLLHAFSPQYTIKTNHYDHRTHNAAKVGETKVNHQNIQFIINSDLNSDVSKLFCSSV